MSLQQIQEKLVCKKTQYNEFGGYYYRNQEDILEAAKPLLAEYNYILNISDSIQLIGDRFYVKAIASILDESGNVISSSIAYAREPAEKKKMDTAQITGATSSYARKYALGGLLAIDDTKDADSQKPENGNSENEYLNEKQITEITKWINQYSIDVAKFLEYMGAVSIDKIVTKDFNKAMLALKKKAEAAK